MFDFQKIVKQFPLLLASLFWLAQTQNLPAQDYQKAWEALNKNDRKAARELFKKAMNSPSTAVDAGVSMMYLEVFEGNDKDCRPHFEAARKSMADPFHIFIRFGSTMAWRAVTVKNFQTKSNF